MQVSPAGYYAWRRRGPSRRDEENTDLSARVKSLHKATKGRYGIRRLTAHLAREGRRHSERRIRRLARELGLVCVHPRSGPKTTVPGQEREGLVDFIGRDFVPDNPGEVLYTDITYVPTGEGWVYVVLFTDGCSRRIVSWEASRTMDTAFVLRALDRALADLAARPGQVIVHSDRGSQYTSKAFRDRCFAAGAIPSVGRTGSCFDNAQAESTNATLKKELINLQKWKDLDEVHLALFEFIEADYNRNRIQKTLGYLTPEEFENQGRINFTRAA